MHLLSKGRMRFDGSGMRDEASCSVRGWFGCVAGECGGAVVDGEELTESK